MRRIPTNQTKLPSIERKAQRRYLNQGRYATNQNSLLNSQVSNSKESITHSKRVNLNQHDRLDPLVLDRTDSGLYMTPFRTKEESSLESH